HERRLPPAHSAPAKPSGSRRRKGATLRIEHSRKHGPFDSRYPPIRHKPAPASLWRLGEEPVDWQRFLARFYPGCRRHDFDALAAYESYCNDAEGRRADDSLALASLSAAVRVARSENARSGGDGEEPPAVAETERWEGEGGATGTSATTTKG